MFRAFELSVTLVGLGLALPVMAIIAAVIQISSGGPVLFRQTRVGQGGKDFTFWKFRTMTVQTDPRRGRFERGNRQHVTWVGRLLRATKLDELPQLFHVLRGEMSLVGPRPPLRRWVEAFPERWARILVARPGITHPAAIVYRHEERLLLAAADPLRLYREEILPRKLDLYERYLASRSGWTDFKVLLQTVWVILFDRGKSLPTGHGGEHSIMKPPRLPGARTMREVHSCGSGAAAASTDEG